MGYSRGYEVDGRGAWSRWRCVREDCGATATTRGDQHDDLAAWDAAAHQEQAHRDALLRDAIEALTAARDALNPLWHVVTDVDTRSVRGTACVSPEDAEDALHVWACQLAAALPEPADPDERARWRLDRDTAVRRACQHDERRPLPAAR